MFGIITRSEHPLFSEVRRLEQELDQLLGASSGWTGDIRSLPQGAFPAINIGATPESVAVYLFAPGIEAKKLEISIQQNLLTVAGERQVAVDRNATYYRQERVSGRFHRVINLPEDVDPERVEAAYRDGVVQITIGRRESSRPRQIQIS
jgi:HSP20 family protein